MRGYEASDRGEALESLRKAPPETWGTALNGASSPGSRTGAAVMGSDKGACPLVGEIRPRPPARQGRTIAYAIARALARGLGGPWTAGTRRRLLSPRGSHPKSRAGAGFFHSGESSLSSPGQSIFTGGFGI